MQFQDIRAFLESWGLHFDTPDGDSTTIPYPQVYDRMVRDILHFPNLQTPDEVTRLRRFISAITDTTDGETYLALDSWEEIERRWHQLSQM